MQGTRNTNRARVCALAGTLPCGTPAVHAAIFTVITPGRQRRGLAAVGGAAGIDTPGDNTVAFAAGLPQVTLSREILIDLSHRNGTRKASSVTLQGNAASRRPSSRRGRTTGRFSSSRAQSPSPMSASSMGTQKAATGVTVEGAAAVSGGAIFVAAGNSIVSDPLFPVTVPPTRVTLRNVTFGDNRAEGGAGGTYESHAFGNNKVTNGGDGGDGGEKPAGGPGTFLFLLDLGGGGGATHHKGSGGGGGFGGGAGREKHGSSYAQGGPDGWGGGGG